MYIYIYNINKCHLSMCFNDLLKNIFRLKTLNLSKITNILFFPEYIYIYICIYIYIYYIYMYMYIYR